MCSATITIALSFRIIWLNHPGCHIPESLCFCWIDCWNIGCFTPYWQCFIAASIPFQEARQPQHLLCSLGRHGLQCLQASHDNLPLSLYSSCFLPKIRCGPAIYNYWTSSSKYLLGQGHKNYISTHFRGTLYGQPIWEIKLKTADQPDQTTTVSHSCRLIHTYIHVHQMTTTPNRNTITTKQLTSKIT